MVELILCQLSELVLVAVNERWESPSLMAASCSGSTLMVSTLLSPVVELILCQLDVLVLAISVLGLF